MFRFSSVYINSDLDFLIELYFLSEKEMLVYEEREFNITALNFLKGIDTAILPDLIVQIKHNTTTDEKFIILKSQSIIRIGVYQTYDESVKEQMNYYQYSKDPTNFYNDIKRFSEQAQSIILL